jgi:hypothetical protein
MLVLLGYSSILSYQRSNSKPEGHHIVRKPKRALSSNYLRKNKLGACDSSL